MTINSINTGVSVRLKKYEWYVNGAFASDRSAIRR